jgi:hypothetical protein
MAKIDKAATVGAVAARSNAPEGAASTSHYTGSPIPRQPLLHPVEAVKAAIDFYTLYEQTVGPLPHRSDGRPAMVRCLFHGDSDPSLAIYADHAHCYGCGWHGDCFDWLMQLQGVDFRAALQELAQRAGVSLRDLSPEERAAAREQRGYEDALARAAQHFAACLQETPAAMEYALGRAWSVETIRAEMIGYTDGKQFPDLGNERAQCAVQVLSLWAGKVGGALVYAHRQCGRVVYLSGRSIVGKHHYNPPADLAGPKRPYLNALYSGRCSEVAVVEGQADAVTLAGWGIPAVALAGSGLTDDARACLVRQADRETTTYAVPDADGRTDLAGLAECMGPLLRVVALPDGVGDVNAWAQEGATTEEFRELLEGAHAWLDLQIEKAVQAHGAVRDRAIEGLFPLLAQLPPVTLARYKGRVTGALEEIGSRDFDRLLKAVQRAGKEEHALEVLDGRYPVIAPALDFVDGLAVVTVPLLARVDGRLAYLPYLVTSDRQMFAADGEQMVNVDGRTVILRDPPTALGNASRWEYADAEAYVEGDDPDPVRVYLEIERLLDKYIDFRDEGTSDVLALWTMGTYLYPLFEAFPYVTLVGPKGSGKTKLVGLVARLAFNGRVASNISSASLFRVVQATRGMLGIDEAERLANPRDPVAADLRLLLNAGYKRGSPVIRCEGDDHRVVEFEVYGPKMIASINGLEDVLESRCILINMLRTAGPKGDLVVSEHGEAWPGTRHGLYCFALRHFAQVRGHYLNGTGADGLRNRQAELWRPLLAIAAHLDGLGAQGLLALVRRYARREAAQAENSSLDDRRTAMVLALHKLATEGKTRVAPKQVREAMVHFMDADEHTGVTSQWVGYRLREFGFKRVAKGGAQGSLYTIGERTTQDILLRYDVRVSQTEECDGDEAAICN